MPRAFAAKVTKPYSGPAAKDTTRPSAPRLASPRRSVVPRICAGGGMGPECAVRAADGKPAAPAPQPAQPAPPAPAPSMKSGSLTIKGDPGVSVTQTGGVIVGPGKEYRIAKTFKVSASAMVDEPAGTTDDFKYGIVQNVMYDHVYQTFTDGDMLVDSVGPMVDVATKDESPFIHASAGNLVAPGALFIQKTAGPSFTDVPSLEVGPKLHCRKSKWVKPLKVERSLAFKAALVAQNVKTKTLTHLGGFDKTYHVKWEVNFERDTDKYAWKEIYQPDGSHQLSASAAAVKLDGTIANDQGQKLLNAESTAFEDRCEPVLEE
jgi:hypothetical protein